MEKPSVLIAIGFLLKRDLNEGEFLFFSLFLSKSLSYDLFIFRLFALFKVSLLLKLFIEIVSFS